MQISKISPIKLSANNNGKGKLFQVRSAKDQLPHLTRLCKESLEVNPRIGLTALKEELNSSRELGCDVNVYNAVLPSVLSEVRRDLQQQ